MADLSIFESHVAYVGSGGLVGTRPDGWEFALITGLFDNDADETNQIRKEYPKYVAAVLSWQYLSLPEATQLSEQSLAALQRTDPAPAYQVSSSQSVADQKEWEVSLGAVPRSGGSFG